jgi:metallo-beta-lactamase class B
MTRLLGLALGLLLAAQGPAPAPGKTWTLEDLFRRNVGTREQQTSAFPPHEVIDNIWYVGTESLASFLITTPQGHILINSSYEANVPVILGSVEKLGFKPSDIKIILGSHAHGDHMEGDAELKRLTGGQVMAMAEDVPALQRMMPAGKPHPIDRVLHDGDTVTLGATTLVARLTPGHTKGCTTWTMKATENGRTYDVVIIGSVGVNPGFVLVDNKDNPGIADEYIRAFKVLRSLPCDVPLASHPAMYNMAEKFKKLGGNPNPFIDPAGYKAELDTVETVFTRTLDEQRKAATK